MNAVPPDSRAYPAPAVPGPGTGGPSMQDYGRFRIQFAFWDDVAHTWTGPEVKAFFYLSLHVRQVFAFYDHVAALNGWKPGAFRTWGLVSNWAKTYPSGYVAGMDLAGSGNTMPPLDAPSRGLYALTASATPIGPH